jgi:HSP90 family molecular chaperone
MTDYAIEQMNEKNSQEFVRMRNTYDEMLKIAAMHLSEKTSKEQLIKLLRICSFIGNDKLTSRLLLLVKPKMNSLDN